MKRGTKTDNCRVVSPESKPIYLMVYDYTLKENPFDLLSHRDNFGGKYNL